MKAIEARVQEKVVSGDSSQTAPPVAARIIGLSKRFGKTSVLEDIHFDVAEGEILVLLGASGSGKTTILRIIAGLEQPYTGRVMLHGKDVTDLPARERGVGVIFQSYALFPKMTVEKNIGYGLKIRRKRRKEIRKIVNELLGLVQLQEHRHMADYDNSTNWSRTQALAQINLAADAFRSWRSVRAEAIAQEYLLWFLVDRP